MNKHSDEVKQNLISLIREMAESPADFVKNPLKDFTRKRKLPFETVALLLLSMGGNSVYKELLEASGYDADTATTSAFIQQRDKILPTAFMSLFRKFTDTAPKTRTYKGFRLLAADGSALNIATDPTDKSTYFQSVPDSKGFNQLHLNALYDLTNRLYIDACVQPRKELNEHSALTQMVDRSNISSQVIVIADRGYESYNNFAHIERKGWKYLIRVRDLDSVSGILSGLRLPLTGEFDVRVNRILTRKQTKDVKSRPDIYRFLYHGTNFDFLDRASEFYPITFRVVRFKITADSFETVITNLDEQDFHPCELKTLYGKRWGVESSFRELKYSVGLVNFHAKKQEYITQEIFARLTMYNFTEMIISHIVIAQSNPKYAYHVNFTNAAHVCRRLLRCLLGSPPIDADSLILHNILPVRPNRTSPRKMRDKTAVSFYYRVA